MHVFPYVLSIQYALYIFIMCQVLCMSYVVHLWHSMHLLVKCLFEFIEAKEHLQVTVKSLQQIPQSGKYLITVNV